jgi:hypothetical protein
MRGNSFEHRIMIEMLEQRALQFGARVQRERPVRQGASCGYTDLAVSLDSVRADIEAENDAKRVANDVRKAIASQATHLFIVAPTAAVARTCACKLGGLAIPSGGPVVRVCTLGTALHQLSVLLSSVRSTSPPAQAAP